MPVFFWEDPGPLLLPARGEAVPSIRLRGQNLRGGFPYSLEPDVQALPLPFTCFLSINFSFFSLHFSLPLALFLSFSLSLLSLSALEADRQTD